MLVEYTEFTLASELTVTECLAILDDASGMGFDIKVESGKIYYKEVEEN